MGQSTTDLGGNNSSDLFGPSKSASLYKSVDLANSKDGTSAFALPQIK